MDIDDDPAHTTTTVPHLVVDVAACSRATWIAPEDCLSVLREMGVAQDAGPDEHGHGQRVSVTRDGLAAWVATQRISLESACHPDGFVRGYAMPRIVSGGEE